MDLAVDEPEDIDAGVRLEVETGVKVNWFKDVVPVIGVFHPQSSTFVMRAGNLVKGVADIFSFAAGDQFSSPSLQFSLSGLDFGAFDMASRFAFCDVRRGEGV